jgi:copper(I)-binding protein
MLFGVKADMIATGSVPVTLTFEQGGTVDVVFSVTEP